MIIAFLFMFKINVCHNPNFISQEFGARESVLLFPEMRLKYLTTVLKFVLSVGKLYYFNHLFYLFVIGPFLRKLDLCVLDISFICFYKPLVKEHTEE